MDGDDDEQMGENGVQTFSTKTDDMIDDKLQQLVENEADYDQWTSLISEIENSPPTRIESICKVYDAFLSEYPLCHGYWKRYADHLSNHCSLDEVNKLYERAVGAVPYSVDIWFSYCSFGISAFEDSADIIRLFKRGLLLVNKDYSSYLLWDKYLEFEHSLKQWNSLFSIYIDAMRFPTMKLNDYYTSFKKLLALRENEAERESDAKGEKKTTMMTESNIKMVDQKATTEIRNPIKLLQNLENGVPSLNLIIKYFSLGEALYQKSSQMDEKINLYESRIRRPYFHIKPLDKCDIDNWHQYLDFVEMQNDFDWAVKLYERCLISCAYYSEFWIRYVEFVEANGGRELARDALERAQKLFIKGVPAFNHYYSIFMEKIGSVNVYSALSAQSDVELDDQFVNDVNKEANAKKRMGKANLAILVYEESLELAKAKKNTKIFTILCTKLAQLKFMLCKNIDPAIEVLLKGIQELPSKLIIQEMMDFVTVRSWPEQMQKLDSIIANLLTPGSYVSQFLSLNDCEEISNLYLQYVDLYGTIDEIRKAWLRHWKLFPHITEPSAGNSFTGTRIRPAIDDVSGLHQDCRDNGVLTIAGVRPNSSVGTEHIEVTKDTALNDNTGTEEQVEVADPVEKLSLPENVDENMEITETTRKQIINDNFAVEEVIVDTDGVKHSEVLPVIESVEIQLEDDNSKEMVKNDIQIPPVHENSITNVACNDEHGNLTQKLNSNAGENVIMDEGINNEVSDTHVPDHVDTELPTPQAQGQISPLNSVCNSTPQESQSTTQLKVQLYENTNAQQPLPLDASNSQEASCYVPTSESQQWEINPQLQHAQPYSYQQASSDPFQNVQLQAYAYTQSQTGVSNPIQGLTNIQGMSAEMLQYYQQQQYYYLQQQQNHQLNNSHQYQEVFYIQQQQHQQLYQHQQQHYYSQQQHIIQQQHFQQLTHYEQQQMLQQHQQHFLSQMQQQVLQLHQQQQLQLQQLQHQMPTQKHQQMPAQIHQQLMAQQQQLHQLPVQQQLHTQAQQHTNAPGTSGNSIQNNRDTQKHSSNHDGSEYEERAVTSQGATKKLHTAEKSAPTNSFHPRSPTNQ